MPCDSDNPVLSALDLDDPPQEVLDFAKRELGEDPETRCQALAEFRDLIYEKGECSPHRMDDAFLVRFLRVKRFVIPRAHRLLVNYYEFKENNPEFFDDVYVLNLKKVGANHLISVPPYREQTGRRILLYRWGMWNPTEVSVVELFQATLLVMELAILEQRAQILGGIALFDFGGLTQQHVWNMTPSIARKAFQVMVTSFPIRTHAVHIVNQPWVFGTLYNFFKPLLSEEMKEKIFIHGDDMESLHQYVDPKHLPQRYGGVHPDYNYDDWVDFFLENESMRFELRRMGYLLEPRENNVDNNIKVEQPGQNDLTVF